MPNPLDKAARVYNIIDFNAYLQSKTMILDNRAPTHLVNRANQLVPKSFYPVDSTNIVDIGT